MINELTDQKEASRNRKLKRLVSTPRPRLDGFPIVFFQQSCGLVNQDVFDFLLKFHDMSCLLEQFSASSISFIPKTGGNHYCQWLLPI